MNQAEALDIIHLAIWTVIVASAPAVGVAMAVGIVISLLQALTQIQEVTLTFVPKIIAILLLLWLTAPLIGGVIYSFTEQVYSRIEQAHPNSQ
jgi:flagellar biosynthesis protein FliQ